MLVKCEHIRVSKDVEKICPVKMRYVSIKSDNSASEGNEIMQALIELFPYLIESTTYVDLKHTRNETQLM